MPEENTVDFAALCEELSARVESLEAQLAEEQDKNAVLVQQVVDAEDNIANREVESFAEVIDPEDKDYWRERMIENREATEGQTMLSVISADADVGVPRGASQSGPQGDRQGLRATGGQTRLTIADRNVCATFLADRGYRGTDKNGAKISVFESFYERSSRFPKRSSSARKKLGEQASCLFGECTGRMPNATNFRISNRGTDKNAPPLSCGRDAHAPFYCCPQRSAGILPNATNFSCRQQGHGQQRDRQEWHQDKHVRAYLSRFMGGVVDLQTAHRRLARN